MAVPTCFNRTKKYLLTALLPFLALFSMLTAAPVWAAEGVIATVRTQAFSAGIAVNPVTNKIYVANLDSNSVTVIDGATNAVITTVAAGFRPTAVAVNPLTNQIYVANHTSNDVTVIDGATHATTTVATGSGPIDIVVNTVTNKIYVASADDYSYVGTVTVIDGATHATTTVETGPNPFSFLGSRIVVNPVTNKIYVVNTGADNVTVLDGATNTTSTVAVGIGPTDIVVNLITNKIYVVNHLSSDVTVIDGATNTTNTIAIGSPTGINPYTLAVNPVTNKVYVASHGSANVTVIDGVTNTVTATVTLEGGPFAIAVNSVTNKIYVANRDSTLAYRVIVIDGATNITASRIAAGTGSFSIAINPVTNRIYTANVYDSTVSVIGELNTDTTPPALTMPSLVDSYIVGSAAVLTFSATDTQSQIASISATLNGSPVSSGGMVMLNQLGLNTFTLTATDTAGNTAAQTQEFVVSYGFGGFLPPRTDDDDNDDGDDGDDGDDSRATFHLGKVIPVKFGLHDANGAPISTAVAHLSLQQFSGNTPVGDPIDATSRGGANAGTLFRYSHGRYIYNLSTKALTAGTWSLQVMLDDGTVQTIMISLTSRRHHD